jgi:hypothetical protein
MNPTVLPAKRTAVFGPSATPRVCPTETGQVGPLGADWWNPFSWNWDHILGTIWNDIVLKCLKGALAGSVGTASTQLATKLIQRVAYLKLGWQGYAVAAISGCVVSITA